VTARAPQAGPARILTTIRAECGEGPIVTQDGRELLWVDILGRELHRTSLADGKTSTFPVPSMIGAVAERASGGIVAAVAEGFAAIGDDGAYEPMCSFLGPDERMNDAKCDAAGRFWSGSTAMDFTAGAGRLYVLHADWSWHCVLDGLTLPNGLGWSPDNRTFYLVDSRDHSLFAFNFDLSSGRLGPRRLLVRFRAEEGMPDGLTVADDGSVWVAVHGGGRVDVFSPDGGKLGQLPLPVRQPTSCAFDGNGRLWVTSAWDGLPDGGASDDGGLFAVDVGARTGPKAGVFAG
jgi:sugar lactone lactonase YvrE